MLAVALQRRIEEAGKPFPGSSSSPELYPLPSEQNVYEVRGSTTVREKFAGANEEGKLRRDMWQAHVPALDEDLCFEDAMRCVQDETGRVFGRGKGFEPEIAKRAWRDSDSGQFKWTVPLLNG